MNSAVQKSLSLIESKDPKARSNAITDIALILEMHSWELNYDQRLSRYNSFLSDNLIKIILDKQDQKEIVVFLESLILKQDKLSSSLIWAIGKSTPDIGLILLLEIIEYQHLTFNGKELYQLLIALGNLLFFDSSGCLNEENKQIVSHSNLASFLEKVTLRNLENQQESNRLRQSAQGLLESIT